MRLRPELSRAEYLFIRTRLGTAPPAYSGAAAVGLSHVYATLCQCGPTPGTCFADCSRLWTASEESDLG
jgi:hypothetical protein